MPAKYRHLLFSICLLGGNAPVLAADPGFECREQQAIAEHLICGSQQLADMDRQLNSVFKKAMRATTLNADKNKRIREEQKSWLKERNSCEYSFDCLQRRYMERLDALREFLPRETFSWGGKLRAGPSVNADDLGSTKERQPITIIENSGVVFNDYPWFKVQVDGKEAYQWGGIICDTTLPDETYCE